MYNPKLDIIEVIMHFRFVSNILQIRFALVSSSTQWDKNGNKSAIKIFVHVVALQKAKIKVF